MDMYALAREITDSVIPAVTLAVGKEYLHPEHGRIKITGGTYRDPVYGRISNWWQWQVVATGETGAGYGSNWPEATEATA